MTEHIDTSIANTHRLQEALISSYLKAYPELTVDDIAICYELKGTKQTWWVEKKEAGPCTHERVRWDLVQDENRRHILTATWCEDCDLKAYTLGYDGNLLPEAYRGILEKYGETLTTPPPPPPPNRTGADMGCTNA